MSHRFIGEVLALVVEVASSVNKSRLKVDTRMGANKSVYLVLCKNKRYVNYTNVVTRSKLGHLASALALC